MKALKMVWGRGEVDGQYSIAMQVSLVSYLVKKARDAKAILDYIGLTGILRVPEFNAGDVSIISKYLPAFYAATRIVKPYTMQYEVAVFDKPYLIITFDIGGYKLSTTYVDNSNFKFRYYKE